VNTGVRSARTSRSPDAADQAASTSPPASRARRTATSSCPPPRHNFVELPRIRSESPAFDLHSPHVAAMDTPTRNKNLLDQVLGEPDLEGGPGGQR
jgi:hypothetical protein